MLKKRKRRDLLASPFFIDTLCQENDPDILPSQPELKNAVFEYVPDLPVIVVLNE